MLDAWTTSQIRESICLDFSYLFVRICRFLGSVNLSDPKGSGYILQAIREVRCCVLIRGLFRLQQQFVCKGFPSPFGAWSCPLILALCWPLDSRSVLARQMLATRQRQKITTSRPFIIKVSVDRAFLPIQLIELNNTRSICCFVW